jgi:TrmH family RNA methyltransferase
MDEPLSNLRVVLVGTRNPLNIGAAARAMSNFGVRHLRLVRPYEVAFREARSAVGAREVMAAAVEFNTVAEAVADCRLVVGTTAATRRELQHELRRLEAGGRAIRKQLPSGPVAVLFGSEKRGLSNDDMSHCHWLMRIPTREEHRSMNLGQAAAVVMYELAKKMDDGKSKIGKKKANAETQRAPRSEEEVTASMETVERIEEALLGALRASGYVAPRGEAKAEEKLRRMLRRFAMEERDADVFLGMIRKILWKLNNTYN